MSFARLLAATAVLWLPLLLIEVVRTNSTSQILASPVLMRGFALSFQVWLAIVVILAACAHVALRTLSATRAGLAATYLSSALVLLGTARHSEAARSGWSPEASLACLVVGAALAAAVVIGSVYRRLPAGFAGAFLPTVAAASAIAFAYQLVRLRLTASYFGAKAVDFDSPGFTILVICSIAGLGIGRSASAPNPQSSRIRSASGLATACALLIAFTWQFWWPGAARSVANEPSDARPPFNLALIMIDTLRADRTTLGGYELDTTPFMASLLEDRATYFEHASSPGASTWPSTAAMFTSRWPYDLRGYDLPASSTTIPEIASDAGYRTAGFTANSLIDRPSLRSSFQHFATYGGYRAYRNSFLRFDLLSGGKNRHALRTMADLELHKVRGATLTEVATRWLAKELEHPFFLYLHLVDPHWPYHHRPGSKLGPIPETAKPLSYIDLLDLHRANRHIADLPESAPQRTQLNYRYDSEVAAADRVVADFFGYLRQTGLDDSTMVIIVGDHGEEFLERGRFGHGHDVYGEQTHVPMLIRWPRGAEFDHLPRRVTTPVSLVDILPTLVDFLDIPAPPDLEGRSLRHLLESNAPSGPLLSMTRKPKTWRVAYREGSLKARLAYQRGHGEGGLFEAQVFDLSHDPTESNPLAPSDSRVAPLIAKARAALDPIWRKRSAGKQPAPVASEKPKHRPSDAAMERLRALGYVD